jgi:uncharacterized RDD family membrane protein YckC
MFCRNCGTQLAADARFCPSCGTSTAATATATAAGGSIAPAFAGSVTRDRTEMLQPLPASVELCSVWRRLGGYLLDGLLVIVTLFIGWLVWSIIVWGRGQSPAKQLLGMRVIRTDNLTAARRGLMFGRFCAIWLIGVVAGATIIGYVLYFWLCWDKNRQEIWDKMCNTVVVNDRDNLLDPRHEQIPAAMPPVPLS